MGFAVQGNQIHNRGALAGNQNMALKVDIGRDQAVVNNDDPHAKVWCAELVLTDLQRL